MNKKRIPYEIFFGLFASLVLYLVIMKSDEDLPWYYVLSFFVLLFYCVFFSILVVLNYMKAVLDKNAGIIISETHFFKNLSVFSSDNILWSDIKGVEILKGRKRNFLVLKLSDNDKYLRNKNFLESYILRKYLKRWESPILIPEKTLDCDLQELKQLITDKLNEYGSQQEYCQ